MRAVILAFGLVACGAENPAGTWVVSSTDFTVNACGFDANILPYNDLAITADSKTMEIDFNDGRPRIECTRRGKTFSCPEIVVETDRQRDALLTTALATEGTVGDTLEGERTGTVTCQGVDCGELESLGGYTWPCAMAFDFSAERGLD